MMTVTPKYSMGDVVRIMDVDRSGLPERFLYRTFVIHGVVYREWHDEPMTPRYSFQDESGCVWVVHENCIREVR